MVQPRQAGADEEGDERLLCPGRRRIRHLVDTGAAYGVYNLTGDGKPQTWADIARAVHAHSAAGLAYVAWLRHPTTGGVLASWASLAQVTWAEPDALVGFLGPAVYEVLHGAPFPAGVQTSEHLAEVGVIDGVVPLEELRDRIAATLRGLTPSGPAAPPAVPASAAGPSVPVDEAETWERVQRTDS